MTGSGGGGLTRNENAQKKEEQLPSLFLFDLYLLSFNHDLLLVVSTIPGFERFVVVEQFFWFEVDAKFAFGRFGAVAAVDEVHLAAHSEVTPDGSQISIATIGRKLTLITPSPALSSGR